MNISACIITNNDGRVLNAIDSIQSFCNEIILVETSGKNDFINEIEKRNVKLYFHNWNNDFSDARNYSISKATKEYILIIDSDEIFKEEIKYLNNDYDYYLLRVNYNGTYHWSIRLFRNYRNIIYSGKLHETIESCTKELRGAKADIDIYHYGYIDNDELQKKLKRNYQILINDVINPYYNFYLGRHYYSVCDYENAIEYFNKSLHENINNENRASVLNMMYDSYLQLKNDPAYMINLLIESIKLIPNQITARAYIINYMLGLNDRDGLKEKIITELNKINCISAYKNSDLPSDNYFEKNFINNKIKELYNGSIS